MLLMPIFPPNFIGFFSEMINIINDVLSCYLLFSLRSVLIESRRHRSIVNFSEVLCTSFSTRFGSQHYDLT